MKKLITLLLAAMMLLGLAACGTNNPDAEPSEQPVLSGHYTEARYLNEDGSLSTVDHYDGAGRILSSEIYSNGAVATYEVFQATDGYRYLDVTELEESKDVASTDYQLLYFRNGEEGDFASANVVFVFGYDKAGATKMAKVFVLKEDSSVLYDYLITYDLDEHGNFTGWTHTTEAGDVLFRMEAENTYDGDVLVSAQYHYARLGNIMFNEDGRFEALETPEEYTLAVEFGY